MTDIEWACKWVGWRLMEDGVFEDEGNCAASLPDLAEAVRVKWGEQALVFQ